MSTSNIQSTEINANVTNSTKQHGNELFWKTVIFDSNLEIVECSSDERFYKIGDWYFELGYPLERAVRIIRQYGYVSHIGVPENTRQYIRENAKTLFFAKLYCLPGKTPTMLVHSNCIYDIRVPLHLIFFPKCLLREKDGTPLYYTGPANVVHENSVINGCVHCQIYGIYRGVFIAFCNTCSGNIYNYRYGYTGYSGLGIDFYNIPPERRVDALPEYFESTQSLTDIGYTDSRTKECFTDILHLENETENPQDYFEFESNSFHEYDQQDDNQIDNDVGYTNNDYYESYGYESDDKYPYYSDSDPYDSDDSTERKWGNA
jgi:hypothetical protein